MKKIILIFVLAIAFNACDINKTDDQPQPTFMVLPVETVTMPTKFATDSVSKFVIKYRRPTTCHYFNGFYYAKNGQTRTVAIEGVSYNLANCTSDTQNLQEATLDFKPAFTGTYNFKFWLGTDSTGVDQYLLFDAIVPN